MPAARIGRTFALVELLRSQAAFIVAPIVLAVVAGAAGVGSGVRVGILITIGFAGASGFALAGLYLLGGARLQAPDLEGWLEGEGSAYDSPPLAATVRDV